MKNESFGKEEKPIFCTTLEKEVKDVRFEEKKSVFLGHAKQIHTEEEALDFIKEMRKTHDGARHNVFAYRLRGDVIVRCSDDGEPQGSAGVPVLDVLRKSGVSDAVLVVTRFFGGILLGAGGLVRAYSHTARLALESAGIVTYEQYADLSMECSYAEYPRYQALLSESLASVNDVQFSDVVKVCFSVRKTEMKILCEKLNESSGGTLSPKILGEHFGTH